MASTLFRSAISSTTKGVINQRAKTTLRDVATPFVDEKQRMQSPHSIVQEEDWEGVLWEVNDNPKLSVSGLRVCLSTVVFLDAPNSPDVGNARQGESRGTHRALSVATKAARVVLVFAVALVLHLSIQSGGFDSPLCGPHGHLTHLHHHLLHGGRGTQPRPPSLKKAFRPHPPEPGLKCSHSSTPPRTRW